MGEFRGLCLERVDYLKIGVIDYNQVVFVERRPLEPK